MSNGSEIATLSLCSILTSYVKCLEINLLNACENISLNNTNFKQFEILIIKFSNQFNKHNCSSNFFKI